MFAYFVRRLLFAVPVIFGVMILTFILFSVVQSPRERALKHLGMKATEPAIQKYIENRKLDGPLLINWHPKEGEHFYDSVFGRQMWSMLSFDFGNSDTTGRPVKEIFAEGALPSLMITLPAFVVGCSVAIALSLYLMFMRQSVIDLWATIFCVALMSVPAMVYIIVGQYVVAQNFNLLPVFGFSFSGADRVRFLLLPVTLMIVSRLGAEVLLYRGLFGDEATQDYVRTARAKGASNSQVLFVHVLKNGLINLITVIVSALPMLIMGSLLIENFFGIPGLGNVLVTAIQSSDFNVVQGSVFFGSILYIIGLLLTDLCYAWADPRIRLS